MFVFVFSDDKMVEFLSCTANTPDCEWRDHLESIVSKARSKLGVSSLA